MQCNSKANSSICAARKKIRNDKGYWNKSESYIRDHSEAEFTHGICQECSFMGEFTKDKRNHFPALVMLAMAVPEKGY
jgi:hypothetical protein